MKLSEYKKLVQDIPAFYDDFEVEATPHDNYYSINDFTIQLHSKEIILIP